MIDVTTTAQDVEARASAALPGVPIYWTAGKVPASNVPSEFLIIEPLFADVNQAWARNTHARHTVQVRACATTVGRATELASEVQKALPADVYETPTAGPLIKVGEHYDMILTAVTHANEG